MASRGCLRRPRRFAVHSGVPFSPADLKEFYHTFVVSPARARRNSIGMVLRDWELAGFKAFVPALHTGLLRTLAMGDSLAVELAQESHLRLLESVGAMRPSERVCYRQPLPRGRFLEFLAIDDHIGAMKVSREELLRQTPLRDSSVFARAEAGYSRDHLVQHQGKKRRGVTSGVFLGCEVEG